MYCNKDGNTPLYLASSLAYPAVVKHLIGKFKCQLDIPNNEEMTLVDLAFFFNSHIANDQE